MLNRADVSPSVVYLDTKNYLAYKLEKSNLSQKQIELKQSTAEDFKGLRIYIVIYILIGLACSLTGQREIFSWAVLVVNIFVCLIGRARQAAFLTSFMMSNELVAIVNILIVTALNTSNEMPGKNGTCGKKTYISGSIVALGSLLLAFSLVNAAHLGTLTNLFVSCAYLTLLAYLFKKAPKVISSEGLGAILIMFVFAQACFIIPQLIQSGFRPSDYVRGSMSDAHMLGIWCCFIAIILLYGMKAKSPLLNSVSRKYTVVALIILPIMLYFADCKGAVFCGLMGLLVWVIVRKIFSNKVRLSACAATFIALFMVIVFSLGTPFLQSALVSQEGFVGEYARTYLYGNAQSLKYHYFEGTLEDMISNGHIIYGYGLGQYGSRFANLLGYESTYRADGAINALAEKVVDSNMLDEYEKYASLYDDTVVAWIGWYSAISIYPFSSMIAIIAEGGIVGIILVLLLLDKMNLASCAQALLMFFLGCCIMDMYFDHIQLIGFVLAIAAISSSQNRALRTNDADMGKWYS